MTDQEKIAALEAERDAARQDLRSMTVDRDTLVKRIEELEKALEGRTVSCVCGGNSRAERAEGLVRKLAASFLSMETKYSGPPLCADLLRFLEIKEESLSLVPVELRKESR